MRWQLCEVFETPPIERWIGPEESLVAVRASWPDEVFDQCRFEIREVWGTFWLFAAFK